jgi:hypothetical protein
MVRKCERMANVLRRAKPCSFVIYSPIRGQYFLLSFRPNGELSGYSYEVSVLTTIQCCKDYPNHFNPGEDESGAKTQ